MLLDPFAGLDPETRLLGETVRAFAREVGGAGGDRARRGRAIRPRARRPDGRAGAARRAVPRGRRRAPGCRPRAWTVVVEEIAAADMALAVTLCVHVLHQNPVVRWGSDEQKARWLPALQSGRGARCVRADGTGGGLRCGRHPDAGRAGRARRIRRTDTGSRGTKVWISNAPEAERYLVFATLDPARGPAAITAFLVEKGTPGFRFGPTTGAAREPGDAGPEARVRCTARSSGRNDRAETARSGFRPPRMRARRRPGTRRAACEMVREATAVGARVGNDDPGRDSLRVPAPIASNGRGQAAVPVDLGDQATRLDDLRLELDRRGLSGSRHAGRARRSRRARPRSRTTPPRARSQPC